MTSNTLIDLQKYGALESDWDSITNAAEMLRKFQGFANKVLKAIDEDPNLSKELKMEVFGNLKGEQPV